MKEVIKPIKDYDGYFISNLGKVYCNIGKGGKREVCLLVILNMKYNTIRYSLFPF